MGDYGEYRDRNSRSVDGIVNSIIGKRRYPDYDTPFLLLEGDKDRKLFKNFVDINRCAIIVADGKQRVMQIVALLDETQFPGVLAIVDADFDVLEGKTYASLNVLHTDAHDIEIMMIASPAFEKVLSEYGSEDKIGVFTEKFGNDIRSILLERASLVGYLRWISLREGLSFDFEELEFNKFVDKETLIADIPKLIKILQTRRRTTEASKKLLLTDTDIQSKINLLWSTIKDNLHVCCGHDLICFLSIGLRKAIGTHQTKTIDPELIEGSLRLAFEELYFRKTLLYKSIREWEQANKPFIILKVES